jgi:hypothetical protein
MFMIILNYRNSFIHVIFNHLYNAIAFKSTHTTIIEIQTHYNPHT